jgi:putative heme-binding domain-containing protein
MEKLRMRRLLPILLLIAVVGGALLLGRSPAAPKARKKKAASPTPEWIWVSKTARDNETVFFRKTFEIKGKVKSAIVAAACDNHVTLFLNGQQLFQHDQWETAARDDVAAKLRPGRNVLAARCQNDSGPAGLLVQLSVVFEGRKRQKIVTDASWLAAADPKEDWRKLDYDAAGWHRAHSFGKLGVAPWGEVELAGPGNATATLAEAITTLPGFRVELLYSVPKAKQGSWVSMTPDPKGRLIVSDQYGTLYRVTPGPNAEATQVEKLAAKIGEAQGLLYAYDSLYVTVNGGAAQGSGFYRLRDTKGTDQFDEVKLLKKFHGGGEHGPHGIRLGPDGLLYVIAGNFTKIPDGLDPHSPHRNYAEDLLLPRNPDGNGFATGVMAPGGWIARTDRDGKKWELFCAGFRNPYDMDFSPDGELFTYDADMEYDTGTPWYRPTRVNHAVSAAEFGWRYGTGKWPAYHADSVGAVIDIGLGSPTGVQFGTGAKFPAKYQRALFLNDWTYGRIYAVHLRPQGASYTATFEVFLEGKPLPVTDLVVNKDGAIYFTTGGRKMQSGLYRVTYTGRESTGPAAAVPNPAAAEARALRRKLEAFHGHKDPRAIEAVWPHLNSPDRALRYAARVAIEHQDLALWRDRALAEKRTSALIQAMLALTRTAGKDLQGQVLARLNSLPFKQLTEEQMVDALRVYGLAFIRLGGKDKSTAPAVAERLNPLFPAQSEFVNRELCSLLVYLEQPTVIERSMKLLRSAHTQEDQMYYVFVLRNLRDGWTAEQRKAYFSWLNLAEAKYRGGASFQKFVQQIRRDAVAKLTEQERVALKEVIEGREKVEVVKLETTRQFVHNWQMSDLEPLLKQVERGRSFAKGKLAYQAGQCYKCHRFQNEGGDTGPDLTGVGNRFDARYILESIILPSQVISDQYVSTVIETKNGRVIIGRIIDQNAKRLLVRTDPFSLKPVEVPLANVDSRRPSPVSEMPQGLINVLTKEEVLDLVAYLRSGGNSKDKAFLKK